jgi:hypothetical protein
LARREDLLARVRYHGAQVRTGAREKRIPSGDNLPQQGGGSQRMVATQAS